LNKTSLPISAWLQSHKTFFFVHLPLDKAARVLVLEGKTTLLTYIRFALDKHSSLFSRTVWCIEKQFHDLADPIKNFWSKFTHSFGKLFHMIVMGKS